MAFLTTDYLQWVGCLFGLLGSALLAVKSRWAGFGFVFYLVSNGCWTAFGVSTGAMGLVAQQIGFTLVSLAGCWTWLVRPRLEKRNWLPRPWPIQVTRVGRVGWSLPWAR